MRGITNERRGYLALTQGICGKERKGERKGVKGTKAVYFFGEILYEKSLQPMKGKTWA